MLRFFFKALIIFWPFFKNVIFKDQTFQEAFRANKQFTFLFVLLMFIILTLFVTSLALSETKGKLQVTEQEVERLTQLSKQLASKNETLAQDVEKDTKKPHCPPQAVAYNKSRVIQLLE